MMVTLRGYSPQATEYLLRFFYESDGREEFLCYYDGYFHVSFLHRFLYPQIPEGSSANCEYQGNPCLLFVRIGSQIIPVDQLDKLLLIEKKEML